MYRTLIVILFVGLTAGCVESSREDPTGKASLRAVNAVIDSPRLNFLVEERLIGDVGYGGVSGTARYDDLSYTFNFEFTVPGESSPRRVLSQFLDVQKDQDYLFVVSGTFANPELTLIEREERQWSENDTVFELGFAHFNEEIGSVDVYLLPPGTAPVDGNAVGTLSVGEWLDPADYEPGDYVIQVTPAGDPQTILYMSPTREMVAATTTMAFLLDRHPGRTANVALRLVTQGGNNFELNDPRFPAIGTVLHASPEIGNVDVYENDDFNAPLAANTAYGERSAEFALADGTNNYTVTDAGNQGAIVLESEQAVLGGYYETLILAGPASEPVMLNPTGLRRPFAVGARFVVLNAAYSQEGVDLYLVPAGIPIDDQLPIAVDLAPGLSTGALAEVAGNYEFVVTVPESTTPLVGPTPLPLANRDVVEIVIMDTADPDALALEIVRHGN